MTPFTPKWKVGDVVGCFVELLPKPKKEEEDTPPSSPTLSPARESIDSDSTTIKRPRREKGGGFFSALIKGLITSKDKKGEGEGEDDDSQQQPSSDQILHIKKDRKMLARFGIHLNGVDIGVWQTIEVVMNEDDRLYPAGSFSTGEGCTFNFGHLPFKYVFSHSHTETDR